MPDITKLTADLRAAIAGATPGEWHVTTEDDHPNGSVGSSPLRNDIALTWSEESAKADSRLIALANPANLTTLLDALDALRVDAERYRWLREQDWFSSDLCVLRDPKKVLTSGSGLGADCPSRDRLDAAIDTARGGPEGGA